MVNYVIGDEGVVHHLVIFHFAEAAMLHTVVDLVLHQGTLQERADPLYGSM